MLFAPKALGNRKLEPEALRDDKKNCLKIGPCGIGKEAIYLNSFYIDRQYYVTYTDVRRVYKRLAMSKGGFTGKGVFGTMPYLVVELSNGLEKQCNFKFEDQVDRFLQEFHRGHPDVPVHSKAAEKKLKEAEEQERLRYKKDDELTADALEARGELERAKAYLEENTEITDELSNSARTKRIIDNINPTYKFVALAICALSIAAIIFGIYAVYMKMGLAIYFVLFGVAGIFFAMSTRVLPTGMNNRKYAEGRWRDAVAAVKDRISGYEGFPVPAHFAHPVVLERMIRVIREGRTESVKGAYELMKEELKALNNTVTVSQKEHDEVVTVKPLFLVCDYSDDIG
ncbi:MAG: DUF308 domain-containing protein [Lachnospiraceae bacterium]|nr:DUF308 domain-containing protein [Lachnospiraceae bacterium]